MSAAAAAGGGGEESERTGGSAPRGASRARGRRSRARLAAVQALYQLELNPDLTAKTAVKEFAQHRLGRGIEGGPPGEADEALFADIVLGATGERDRLDAALSSVLAAEWPLPRLDAVLRAILRAGAYELASRPDVPPRVAIDEYTTIAHAFFSGKEPAFANGVLDRLGRDLRAAEF